MSRTTRSTATETSYFFDRRSGADRRRERFNFFRRPFAAGRRRSMRRQEDCGHFHLFDYYSPRLFYAVILILLLSMTDALLTLWLIGEGATELNPIMAYFLNFGPTIFIAVKYTMTSVSVVIVILFNYILIKRLHFKLGNLLNYFAVCLAAVVIWEIVLFARYVI